MQKAAGLGVVGVGGRDRHQAAQTDVLPGGGSLQKREQAVGVHAALAGLLADVDLDENVLHQPQTAAAASILSKRRVLSTLWISAARPTTLLTLFVCKCPMKCPGLPL